MLFLFAGYLLKAALPLDRLGQNLFPLRSGFQLDGRPGFASPPLDLRSLYLLDSSTGTRASRKPRRKFRKSGESLRRYADRQDQA